MARDIRQSKLCTACGLEFFKKPHQKWIRWRCDPCTAIYDKEARKVRGPAYRMWAAAKHRAKLKNLEFTIKVEDIVVPVYCPVLGFKLVCGNRKQCNSSPSLDRVDNTKGYSKDNIQVMSLKANRIKTDATLEELKSLVKYLEQ